jgi:tRNA-binding EMAP/Myf-like protein
VAEVVRVDPHPKAGDKLRVCEVDTSYARFKVGVHHIAKIPPAELFGFVGSGGVMVCS